MPTGSAAEPLPLPRGWPKIVNSAVLHAFSIAATALTAAWGRAAGSGLRGAVPGRCRQKKCGWRAGSAVRRHKDP